MGITGFIKSSRRILKLATKPARSELWMSTKVSILAMFAVGMMSFLIQILMTTITSGWGVAASSGG